MLVLQIYIKFKVKIKSVHVKLKYIHQAQCRKLGVSGALSIYTKGTFYSNLFLNSNGVIQNFNSIFSEKLKFS